MAAVSIFNDVKIPLAQILGHVEVSVADVEFSRRTDVKIGCGGFYLENLIIKGLDKKEIKFFKLYVRSLGLDCHALPVQDGDHYRWFSLEDESKSDTPTIVGKS